MSGSESKTEEETRGSSPNESDRTSLADFLAPPRARTSVPAPARAEDSEADAAEPEAEAEAKENDSPPEASTSAAEATTPIELATVSEVPPAAEPTTAIRGRETVSDEASAAEPAAAEPAAAEPAAAEPTTAIRGREAIPSVAPSSAGDAAARSLIPVATSADSDAPPDDLEDYSVPGARGALSGAAIRRVTYVALLAAAAAVPAWVVFRARSVDVQPRADIAAAKVANASAGPTTPAPAREIEADDNEPAEPPPAAVPVDPAKALELRREARRLLESGQIDPGVAAARNSIALNPADPESYVLLAAGLQDQGRWAESREVFSRCIHKSKDSINAECVYFATSQTVTNR